MSKLQESQCFQGQLGAKLKKYAVNNHFVKGIELQGFNQPKSWVKLKANRSFKGQLRSYCIYLRPRNKVKTTRKCRTVIEICMGQNQKKLKVLGQYKV